MTAAGSGIGAACARELAAAGYKVAVMSASGKGEALKVFHVRDGYGIRRLIGAGIEVAVISGRRSAAVSARCRELGIGRVMQGADDKLAAFERLRQRAQVGARACACVGDDLPDLPLFGAVGLAFAVADAHPLARRAAHHVTALPGGMGAVREVCDRLLAAKARKGSAQ